MTRVCGLVALLAFVTGCFGANAPVALPTPAPIQVKAPDESINYYTIPMNTPAHIIICVELPQSSPGHDNIRGGAACGFTVGQLRELYIRQKKS
jgi:hypothetical protein